MVEDIFVPPAVLHLHAFQCSQFREDKRQQSRLIQQQPTYGGLAREHDFVEFIGYTLAGDDTNALAVAHDGVEGVGMERETELGGEADCPHHTQGVVGERDVGVKRRADNHVLHVLYAVEGVEQGAVAVAIEADSKGVDGEVAAVLVFFEGAVLHDGVAGVVAVTLFARTHKLQLHLAALHLRCAVGAEDGEVRTFAKPLGNSLR